MRKFGWIAAAVVIIDQVVKWACMGLTQRVTVIPGVLALTYTENTGMAFSLFSGRAWALGVVSAVCILVGWLALRRYTLGPWSKTGAMLMLGGAVGNMIDRFLRGYVVDMFYFTPIDFPVFNVADIFLTCGCGALFVYFLFFDDKLQKAAKEEEDTHGNPKP